MQSFEIQLLRFLKLCRENNHGGMTPGQIARIAEAVRHRRLLVFGVGRSASFWNSIASELTVVEDDPSSIDNGGVKTFQMIYWGCLGLPLGTPDEVLKQIDRLGGSWDVVLVDGPRGHAPGDPGREESIYAAAALRGRIGSTVLVHDYEREWERACCDRFLGKPDELLCSEVKGDDRVLAIWRARNPVIASEASGVSLSSDEVSLPKDRGFGRCMPSSENGETAALAVGSAVNIPKIVHSCWFGNKPMSEESLRWQESWKRVLPDYEMVEWNDGNLPPMTPEERDVFEDDCGKGRWADASDLIRLKVLQQQGGIYLDKDIEVLKPFDGLLGERCVVGFQIEEEMRDWINGAVMLAEPNHPFVARCLAYRLEFHRRYGRSPFGPTAISDVAREWGLRSFGDQHVGSVRILEPRYFYPFSWRENYSPGKITPDTICVHYWEYAWRV